jgi:hypothetical protein
MSLPSIHPHHQPPSDFETCDQCKDVQLWEDMLDCDCCGVTVCQICFDQLGVMAEMPYVKGHQDVLFCKACAEEYVKECQEVLTKLQTYVAPKGLDDATLLAMCPDNP